MPNYRSLIPGGYFSSPSEIGKVPASVWSNNPGAVNGATKAGNPVAWVQASPGFVKTVVIGGGNPIAVFETPEHGVALWYELMVRYRRMGKTSLQDIVNKYGGGQDYSAYVSFVVNKTGFSAGKEINLNDDKVVLPFFRAMIHYEAGKPTPLSDAQIAYGINLARGKPATQPVVTPALRKGDFAAMIAAAMAAQGIPIDKGDAFRNAVYVEGMDPDGTPNKNRRNAFDDVRTVLVIGDDGVPKLLGAWEATIETGVKFTENPIASDGKGAARIAFGHHRGVWIRGLHRGYDAFVQQGNKVAVYRDNNKDYSREGDPLDVGFFGINQHHAFNAPRDNIGGHSAGCLVGRTVAGHEEFMRLMTQDSRYRANPGFKFSATVLKAADMLAAKPKPIVTKPEVGATVAAGGAAATVSAWLGAHPSVIFIAFCAVAIAVGVFLAWRSKS